MDRCWWYHKHTLPLPNSESAEFSNIFVVCGRFKLVDFGLKNGCECLNRNYNIKYSTDIILFRLIFTIRIVV